jgi:LysM repeat protein
MNNPNPFVPQGSLLEHNKRRSRMKLYVSCVVVAGAAGLVTMLIQGCQRHEETETPPPTESSPPMMMETSLPPIEATSPPVVVPPPVPTNTQAVAPLPPVVPVAPPTAGTEYVVVKGDMLYKIAKAHGVTLKALEDANPGVEPSRLKIGQKLTIPAGGSAAPAAETSTAPNDMTGVEGEQIYSVKSGDTLSRIARHYATTVKAIEEANHLSTTKIKVGQKLKIPASAAAATPAPTPAPVSPAPMTPPDTTPAPGGMPSGQ